MPQRIIRPMCLFSYKLRPSALKSGSPLTVHNIYKNFLVCDQHFEPRKAGINSKNKKKCLDLITKINSMGHLKKIFVAILIGAFLFAGIAATAPPKPENPNKNLKV